MCGFCATQYCWSRAWDAKFASARTVLQLIVWSGIAASMSDEEIAGKAVGLMLQGSAESNPGLSEDQRKARLALARAFSEGHGPEACDALSAQRQIEASNESAPSPPSPVKRKAAAINLTRSDSEGEAPKRRRRVIEIESESDDDDAPRPTTSRRPCPGRRPSGRRTARRSARAR